MSTTDANSNPKSAKSNITLDYFYKKLNERVSDYNARLTLQNVTRTIDLPSSEEECLNLDDAKSICLALINKGGPAFQVGKDIYQQL